MMTKHPVSCFSGSALVLYFTIISLSNFFLHLERGDNETSS